MTCWRTGSTGLIGKTCGLAHTWATATALTLRWARTVGAWRLELAIAVFTGWAIAATIPAIAAIPTVTAWCAASVAATVA